MVIPLPIHDYIDSIGITVTQSGDKIHTNLPEAAIPRYPLEDPVMPSGSFGPIDEDTHNANECYMSPFITSALVQQTIATNNNRQFGAWNPLTIRTFPDGAVCTPNLLGYWQPERLTPEGMNVITGLHFENDESMVGRSVMTRYIQDFEIRIGMSEPSPNP